MSKMHYNEEFYTDQVSGSYESARLYIQYLREFYRPTNVVDLGCGRGTWLKAFLESGSKRAVGFDGPWNSQKKMSHEQIEFHAADLNEQVKATNGERFDLAMSVEVAEHLRPSSAATFVKSLTDLADVVLFGSAFTAQGGTNHINEQPHTYWAREFSRHGFIPFDMFRPKFWGNEAVEWWYRQNVFLYVRKDSESFKSLLAKNAFPISNFEFMDCIHPALFSRRLAMPIDVGFITGLKLAGQAFVPALKKRFGGS